MVIALIWLQTQEYVERGEDFFRKYDPFNQPRFKKLVAGSTVAMGTRTFLENGGKGLSFCKTIVLEEKHPLENTLSRPPLLVYDPDILVLPSCVDLCENHNDENSIIYVVGGINIFHGCLDKAKIIYCENFDKQPNRDDEYYPFISIPRLGSGLMCSFQRGQPRKYLRSLKFQPQNWIVDPNYEGYFTRLIYREHPENQYLDLIKKILKEGVYRMDRTNTGTYSLFGTQMRFPLTDMELPIITTKYVYWKTVLEELLWFIRGSTDSKPLEAKRVKIWKDNSSREFLDRNGFPERREGNRDELLRILHAVKTVIIIFVFFQVILVLFTVFNGVIGELNTKVLMKTTLGKASINFLESFTLSRLILMIEE